MLVVTGVAEYSTSSSWEKIYKSTNYIEIRYNSMDSIMRFKGERNKFGK